MTSFTAASINRFLQLSFQPLPGPVLVRCHSLTALFHLLQEPPVMAVQFLQIFEAVRPVFVQQHRTGQSFQFRQGTALSGRNG